MPCKINVLDENWKNAKALLLKKDGVDRNINDFYIPNNREGNVIIQSKQKLYLACPGSKLEMGDLDMEEVEVTCKSGKFTAGKRAINYTSFTCKKRAFYEDRTAKEALPGCNRERTNRNVRTIDVGFKFKTEKFITILKVCFDDDLKIALYSKFLLTHAIGAKQLAYPEKNFKTGKSYAPMKSIDDMYSKKKYKPKIKEDLNIEEGQHIDFLTSIDLNRGHLSNAGGFLYTEVQKATHMLVNAVPQWSSSNRGNWKKLEDTLNGYVNFENDLEIYTGTFDVLSAPNLSTGDEVKLYLGQNNDLKFIPIPKWIWKLVYNPHDKSAIVFVLENNLKNEMYPEKLCAFHSDFIQTGSLTTWKHSSEPSTHISPKDYIYVCKYHDFKSRVPYAPTVAVEREIRNLIPLSANSENFSVDIGLYIKVNIPDVKDKK